MSSCTFANCPIHHPDECDIAYHESGAYYDTSKEDYEEGQEQFCTAPESAQ